MPFPLLLCLLFSVCRFQACFRVIDLMFLVASSVAFCLNLSQVLLSSFLSGAAAIAAVQRHLLISVQVTWSDAHLLSSLPIPFPNLKSLRLFKGWSAGINHLTCLPSGLISLSLFDCNQMSDAALQHLSHLSLLRHLQLDRCLLVTNAGLLHVARLSSLQSLTFGKCPRITDEGLQHLSALSALQSLGLSGSLLVVGSSLTFTMPNLSSLTSLSGCFNDAGLAALTHLTGLQSLDIAGSEQVTGEGLQHVARLSGLRRLSLQNCIGIGGSGFQHLSGLSNLRGLNLSGTMVNETAVRHLAPLSALQSLNLSWSRRLMDEHLLHLSGLHGLRALDISRCRHVSGAGLRSLSGLVTLQELNMEDCKSLTDAGLEHLQPLTALQHLNLAKTRPGALSAERLKHLRACLPRLQCLNTSPWEYDEDGCQMFARTLFSYV